MENSEEKNSQANCDCSSGCCTPTNSKKSPCKIIIFALVFIAAAAIIGFKFLSEDKPESKTSPCQTDTTKCVSGDTTAKPCCPGNSSCSESEE